MQTAEQKLYNESIPGWLSEYDMVALSTMAASRKHGAVIVEVGSMHGKSAYCLSTSAPEANIFCYDLWPGNGILGNDDVTRENKIETFQSFTHMCTNITPIKIGSINDINWDTTIPVDMMFLDAAHTNPSDWEMIEYWLPKIAPGGIICGHDYYTVERNEAVHYPDINANVRRLGGRLNQSVTLHKYSCVWSFFL